MNNYKITLVSSPPFEVNVQEPVRYNVIVNPLASNPPNLLAAQQVVLKLTTASPIGGQRAVALENGLVTYADKDEENHINSVLGITKFSVSSGEISIVSSGEIDDPSWSWTPNSPIFVGNNGILTQELPTTGFSQQIAFALTETKISVTLFPPIKL